MQDAHGANEKDTGFVAVADGPADKVGLSLVAECLFDHVDGWSKGRWMRSVLQCVENGGASTVGQGKLSGRVWGNVVADDAGDFGAEWLNADYEGFRRKFTISCSL